MISKWHGNLSRRQPRKSSNKRNEWRKPLFNPISYRTKQKYAMFWIYFSLNLVGGYYVFKCLSTFLKTFIMIWRHFFVKLLKFHGPVLVKTLIKFINPSLVTGILPFDLFNDINISTIAKGVSVRLYDYLNENDSFYSCQYSLCKSHSTGLTGLELSDRISKDIDDENVSSAVYRHWSKAFDILNHEILLKFLNTTILQARRFGGSQVVETRFWGPFN